MVQDPLFEIFRQIEEQSRMAYLAEKFFDMKNEGVSPSVYRAIADSVQYNQGETSDRKPCCSIDAWHKYWQIATMKLDNEMECSCCGKKLYSLTSDPRCLEESRGYDEEGKPDQPENHKAHGGHIYVKAVAIPAGLYITPLCPHCNAQHNQNISIREGALIVAEICSK